LVKDGDDGLVNQVALLSELRGREIVSKNIQDAIGRASFRGDLRFVPTPRKVNPLQHTSDGTTFLHEAKNPRYHGGKLNHSYKEPESKPAQQTGRVDAWEKLCKQLLNYGTHGQQAAMREAYDSAHSQGKSWREVYAEMSALRKSYERPASWRF
jgi:hypothetical protein